jgi:ribonuclease BN (tRNA processing enzyme)
MELTVLGGAAACPNPGQGSSSYLLRIEGGTWLLDCGPNTIQELRKHAELDEIEHIFISHVHSDHTLDLVPMRYGLKYAPGMKTVRPELHMPPQGRQFLDRVAHAFAMGTEGAEGFFDDVFHVSEYDPHAIMEFNGLTIRFHLTNHPVPCWAMRFESAEATLVYLADTGPQETLTAFAEGADILICEGTFPDLEEVADMVDRPHLSAFEAGEIARDARAKEFILTHLWSTPDPMHYLEAATEGYGGQVTLARPGVKASVARRTSP